MKNYSFFMCFLFCAMCVAQVGINNADPKAQLHINATRQEPFNGVIIPQTDEFPSPVTADQDSMLAFITGAGSVSRGYWYYDHGVGWKKLVDAASATSLRAYLNPRFPDGFLGMQPVTFNLNLGTFQVPQGKNLYVTSVLNGGNVGFLGVQDHSASVQRAIFTNTRGTSSWPTFNNPVIFAESDVLFGSFAVNGFLVDATVEPLFALKNYTVPANKIFVFLNGNNQDGSSTALISINGIAVNLSGTNNSNATDVEALAMPLFVDAGQTIASSRPGTTINGYLIDK